jgi:hypothetical protein
MATSAVAPGAAPGGATHGLRHQRLSTRSEAQRPRAPVTAGRASPNSSTTEGPARLAAPDERSGAG